MLATNLNTALYVYSTKLTSPLSPYTTAMLQIRLLPITHDLLWHCSSKFQNTNHVMLGIKSDKMELVRLMLP